MAKYTRAEFRHMAKEALRARNWNDPRYGQLVATMQVFTGWPRLIVEEKIRALANG